MYDTNNISIGLIEWYRKNKRYMPWRETKDPYKIWLSEVMLQQTQVKTVIPYYKKWIENFPSFESVARAELDSLLKLWEGLGYYNRCKNFHKAVNIIVKNYYSTLPKKIEEFKSLPGVGEYTAAAVYSISFSENYPVLDGNVKRVMCRMLGVRHFTSFNKKKILSKLSKWIDQNDPGTFNQALMELGNQICRPKNPLCNQCPISVNCKGFGVDNPESYPISKPKSPVPWYEVLTGIIWSNDSFLILKRYGYSHLTNLWELPGGKIQIKEKKQNQLINMLKNKYNLNVSDLTLLGSIHHKYSHFGIHLSGFNCRIKNINRIKTNQPFRWIKTDEISQYAFPKANHKLFCLLKNN